MNYNNFKIAFRNLIRDKGYSFINIFGLATSMASVILIALWINHETSYDNYHKNTHRIYRITQHLNLNGRIIDLAKSPAPVGEAMVTDFPEVIRSVRFRTTGTTSIEYNNKNYREHNWVFADSSLLDIFTIPLVQGNTKQVLVQPNSAIISQNLASRIFGKDNPLGKSITLTNDMNITIEGIYKDIPDNSHFHFNMIVSLSSIPDSRSTSWLNTNYNTYILVAPHTNIKTINDKLDDFALKHFGPDIERMFGKSIAELSEDGSCSHFKLQPLRDIYLHSDLMGELGDTGDVRTLYIMTAIGLFILLIACINFINLSTAQSLRRAREVGIKKTLGASRVKIMTQFFGETILLTLISLNFALVIAQLMLPIFNQLSNKELILDYTNPILILELLGIILVTGLLAGLYPATVLSSFKPIKTLKGIFVPSHNKASTQTILVIFQFAMSISLIIGTLVIFSQLRYIRHKDIGYNKNQVLILDQCQSLGNNAETFRHELLKNTMIDQVSITGFLPVPNYNSTSNVFTGEHSAKDEYQLVNLWPIDFEYAKTMGLKIVMGRDFNSKLASDSMSCLINETALRKFGWSDVKNRTLSRLTSLEGDTQSMRVVGVVKDFHFMSLHQTITPMVLYVGDHNTNISIRYKGKDTHQVLDFVEKTWKRFLPQKQFSYNFMDERYQQIYDRENRTKTIFLIFTLLSILISCLGLLGLSSYITQRRVKELGVRKVMGATTLSLVIMLIKQFSRWICVATVIAIPLTHILMTRWLNTFAYHTQLSWWLFALGASMALIIAMGTTAYQAYLAANRNPVESLRSE